MWAAPSTAVLSAEMKNSIWWYIGHQSPQWPHHDSIFVQLPAINWQCRHIGRPHMAVGHLLSLVRRCGTRCQNVYMIPLLVLLFLSVFWKHSSSQSTTVSSALEALAMMRYRNLRFTLHYSSWANDHIHTQEANNVQTIRHENLDWRHRSRYVNEGQLITERWFEIKSFEATFERLQRWSTNGQWNAVPDLKRGGRECTTADHVVSVRSVVQDVGAHYEAHKQRDELIQIW